MMMVERHAAAQASVKPKRWRAGMSAANVGANSSTKHGLWSVYQLGCAGQGNKGGETYNLDRETTYQIGEGLGEGRKIRGYW